MKSPKFPVWEIFEGRPRSLSGIKIEQDRLVRFIYVDESGISLKDPLALVAGVIINADLQWKAVEKYVNQLIAEYVPKEHRKDFSFHATDLYHCSGKVFDHKKFGYPRERAREALKHLLSIPRLFGLPVSVGFVNKQAPFPADAQAKFAAFKPRTRAAIDHSFAYSLCCIAADLYMVNEASDEVAQLVAENNTDTQKAIKFIHRFLQGKWESESMQFYQLADIARVHPSALPITRIVDTVLFADKDGAPLLQIADACAFILRYWAQGKSGIYFDEYFDALIGDKGKLAPPESSIVFQGTLNLGSGEVA